MYIPPEFEITDEHIIDIFLQNHSFGILSATTTNGKMVASHLPFVIEKDGDNRIFYTHLANQNELAQARDGDEVLLIFTGEHGYVSSSWYGHPNVPTWNYQAVHVYGKIEKISEEDLYLQLKKLTALHEKSVDGHIDPEKLPQRMIHGYLQHIGGYKIIATKTEAAFKLSQNRNQKDFESIIEKLNKLQPNLAKVMVDFYSSEGEKEE